MARQSLVVLLFAGLGVAAAPAVVAESTPDLQPPSAFDSIADRDERSAALFGEMGRVLQSPRCLNCHPVERSPTQGDDLHPHVPAVHGGSGDHGDAGYPCGSCHGAANAATLVEDIASIPGDSHWALAPASMAWQGKTLAEICAQLKDTARNGNRSLEKIREHMSVDTLVGWAWQPGAGRTSAPGTQAQFGALIAAWIETGANCPRHPPTAR